MTADVSSTLEQHGEAIVSTAIGVAVTLAVAFFIFYLQRRRKTLDWASITNAPLTNPKLKLAGGLTGQWEGKSVTDPYIMVLRILNTGGEEISDSDYTRPISFSFKQCSLISANPADSSDDVEPEIAQFHAVEAGDAKVTLEPIRLDRAEWFDIQFLFDGKAKYPDVDVKIFGHTRPAKRIYPAFVNYYRSVLRSLQDLAIMAVMLILLMGVLYLVF